MHLQLGLSFSLSFPRCNSFFLLRKSKENCQRITFVSSSNLIYLIRCPSHWRCNAYILGFLLGIFEYYLAELSLKSSCFIVCFAAFWRKSQNVQVTRKSYLWVVSLSRSKKCRNDLADYSKDTVTFWGQDCSPRWSCSYDSSYTISCVLHSIFPSILL